MPTYEYACPACNAVYDLRQSFSAETTHTCEECGKGAVKRVLHAPPVVFKGSGWYATDSRPSKSTGTDSATSGESSGSESAAAPTKESSPQGSSKESSGKESSGKESSKESSAKPASSGSEAAAS